MTACRAGQRPQLEAYLPLVPQAERGLLLRALLQRELEHRGRSGDTPTPEELRHRLPEYADIISSVFESSRPAGDETVDDRPAPQSPEDLPRQVGRYLVQHEIGRGGMGRIIRVRDQDFDRPLAMKVLLLHGGATEERFVREARLTGLLQHPGIPPVHVLGQLADGRPYFIMKLIQGRSLQELLKERSSPAVDLPRFLGIFTQICQTVGYAHAQGVIHRDLKPGNVMVGAFGEVQVMDWGLAKVLRTGGRDDATFVQEAETTLQVCQASAEQTQAGSMLGTPAYMAPEQARGEIDKLDARSDVFGLGAILCTIPTGAPPYRPVQGRAVARRGAEEDLVEACQRLAQCGADVDLVQLAQRCLAPRQDDRPADGAAVAAAVAGYQAELERRLRQAEIDRAAAAARADVERKRRRTALALAFAVVLLVVGGSVAARWYWADQVRQQTELDLRRKQLNKEVGAALAEVADKRDRLHGKLLHPRQVYELLSDIDQWQVMVQGANAAMEKAHVLAKGAPELLTEEVAKQLRDLQQKLDADDKEWKIGKRLDNARLSASAPVDRKFDYWRAAKDYPEIFRGIQLDVERLEPGELANRISRSPLRYVLVAGLDHWAFVASDDQLQARVLQVARLADPHPWRDRFRDVKVWNNSQELEQLAQALLSNESLLQVQSPHVLIALAWSLRAESEKELGVAILRQALLTHPRDFWLYFHLGHFARDPLAQLGYCQTCVALRPTSAPAHINLGKAFRALKDEDRAIGSSRCGIVNYPAFLRLRLASA